MKLLEDFKQRREVHAENVLTLGCSDRRIDGWIRKDGVHGTKSNHDRWFVLEKDGLLHYCDDGQSNSIRGTIWLNGSTFHKEDALLMATLHTRFSLTVKKSCLEVHRERVYKLSFHSTHDLKDWTVAFTEQIQACKDVTIIQKEGYLEKRGHVNPDWTRRYFILVGPLLLYLKDEAATETLGFLHVSKMIRVDKVESEDGSYDAARPHSFRIQHAARDLVCSTLSSALMDEWIQALRDAMRIRAK